MQKETTREQVRKGLPLSSGVVVAPVCRFHECAAQDVAERRVADADATGEVARFRQAVQDAASHMEILRREAASRLGAVEADIFAAQKMVLLDETWHGEVIEMISRDYLAAESATAAVLDRHEARMRGFADAYLQDRASDIVEIKRRILLALGFCGNAASFSAEHANCHNGRNRIIVARELTPSLTLSLDMQGVKGFITERGGANSHAAILARALGIPAVTGIEGLFREVECGVEAALNGSTGEVVVRPSAETRELFLRAAGRPEADVAVVAPVAGVEVMANINVAADVDAALKAQADGIGLYRTEFEFLAAGRMLTEDEQYERYSAVVKAMRGATVTFRLFDGGGDKPMPFLERPVEDNPALGWRGSRLLMDRTDLLGTQARALARASQHGAIRVMYPLIVDVRQFERLRRVFDAAVADVPRGTILHGVMLEVPAACLQVRELLLAADFGSIGTNDLVQHLFAVDRNNVRVAYDYDPDRPVFWRLLNLMSNAARQTGRPLSICGEMAANPDYLLRLLQTGIRSVSVSSRLIATVRRRASEVLSNGTASTLPAELAADI